jgi:hypothetical protein
VSEDRKQRGSGFQDPRLSMSLGGGHSRRLARYGYPAGKPERLDGPKLPSAYLGPVDLKHRRVIPSRGKTNPPTWTATGTML